MVPPFGPPMAKALVHFSDGLKQANMVVNHHAPPTTSQSVFPVADQRLPFTSVWILRGSLVLSPNVCPPSELES